MTPRERVEDEIVLSKCVVNDGVAVAVYSLLVHDDFTWDLHVHQMHLEASSSPLAHLLTISSISNMEELITLLESCSICIGNPDEKYMPLSSLPKQNSKIHQVCCIITTYMQRLHGFNVIRLYVHFRNHPLFFM